MKKLLAALLAAILAGSGLSIVDVELTNRVDFLESQVEDMSAQLNELEQKYEKLTVNEKKIGDSVNVKLDPLFNGTNGFKAVIFDKINITAKIVDICEDPNNEDYYSRKYTIEFTVSGKVNKDFFDVCKWHYEDIAGGYGCVFEILNNSGAGGFSLELEKPNDTFSFSQRIKMKSAEDMYITITEIAW